MMRLFGYLILAADIFAAIAFLHYDDDAGVGYSVLGVIIVTTVLCLDRAHRRQIDQLRR